MGVGVGDGEGVVLGGYEVTMFYNEVDVGVAYKGEVIET